MGEDGVEVAFKQSTGVLEVLFGVGFGGGDAGKRFVQDAHDPPLFGKGSEWNGELRKSFSREVLNASTREMTFQRAVQIASEKIVEKRICCVPVRGIEHGELPFENEMARPAPISPRDQDARLRKSVGRP